MFDLDEGLAMGRAGGRRSDRGTNEETILTADYNSDDSDVGSSTFFWRKKEQAKYMTLSKTNAQTKSLYGQ